MMTAPELLARGLGYLPTSDEVKLCGLCGANAPAKYWKEAIKDSNTSQTELKAQHICWACEACMNDSRTRSNSIIEYDKQGNLTYRKPERKEIWSLLLNPPNPPFMLYLTLTAHKHGIWRQHVATSGNEFRLQCEELSCRFNPKFDQHWMQTVAHLLQAGARRDSIETGRYGSSDYLKAGAAVIAAAERELAPIRGRSKWSVVYGVMPGREDIGGVKWRNF